MRVPARACVRQVLCLESYVAAIRSVHCWCPVYTHNGTGDGRGPRSVVGGDDAEEATGMWLNARTRNSSRDRNHGEFLFLLLARAVTCKPPPPLLLSHERKVRIKGYEGKRETEERRVPHTSRDGDRWRASLQGVPAPKTQSRL